MTLVREDNEFEIVCDTCGKPAASPADSHQEAVDYAKAARYDFIPLSGGDWSHRCRGCRLQDIKNRLNM